MRVLLALKLMNDKAQAVHTDGAATVSIVQKTVSLHRLSQSYGTLTHLEFSHIRMLQLQDDRNVCHISSRWDLQTTLYMAVGDR